MTFFYLYAILIVELKESEVKFENIIFSMYMFPNDFSLLNKKEVKVMNMTYDYLELYLGKMYAHIENEIQHALKDEQYLNRETLLKVCRLRDSLKSALHATQDINILMK